MNQEQKRFGEEHERRVGLALAHARGAGYAKSGHEIVFEVIRRANDIERRMRVAGGPGGNRSLWPDYTHTAEEREHALAQRMVDLAAGDPADVVFGLRTDPNPAELATMESINHVFRQCLMGRVEKLQVRDWKILNGLAKGQTCEFLGKKFHMSKAAVSDRKIIQCGAIWRRVCHLMPETQTGTGVVLKDAA